MVRGSRRLLVGWAAALCLLAAVGVSEADFIDIGVPVVSFTDSTSVGNEGWNGFFIPVDPDYNGTFGVTDVPAGGPVEGKAGQVSDNGNGSLTSLDMYMFFDDFEHPTAAASLLFLFKDLDLEDDNTPDDMFETVQFSTSAGDFTGVLDTHGNGVNYSMFGGNDFRAIFFPDVVSLITSSSLTVKLNFTGDGYGENTKEKIKGVLFTKPAPPIPEPSTMILLGLGIGALVARKRFASQKTSQAQTDHLRSSE